MPALVQYLYCRQSQPAWPALHLRQEQRRGGPCAGSPAATLPRSTHRQQQQPHEGLCHREVLEVQLLQDEVAADLAPRQGDGHRAGPACAAPKVIHRQPGGRASMEGARSEERDSNRL